MTEKPDEILAAVEQVRDLFEEISKLLISAESELLENGWERATSTDYAFSGLSYSPSLPRRWMPYELARFLRHTTKKNLMAFVCVILGDANRDDLVEKPLVSGVLVDFGEGVEAGNNWEYWFAGFHKYMTDRHDGGEICRDTDPDIMERNKISDLSVQSFAYPLVEMKTAEELNEKVVTKLLEMCDGET